MKDKVKGFLFALVLMSLLAFRSGDMVLTQMAGAIDADGTADITISSVLTQGTSADCTFVNRDATNSLDLSFNGDAGTRRLGPGESYSTNTGNFVIAVQRFVSTPVAGTPDLDWSCWGAE